MKKIVLIPIFILVICFFTVNVAGVTVTPAKFSIILEDDYKPGNFTGIITVSNNYEYNISVNARLQHPDPLDYMQPGRTIIKNLAWIKIEPSNQIISADGKGKFYVNFSVPEEYQEECLDSRWESWASLKINAASEENAGSINEGYLVRIYINTPVPPEEPVEEPNTIGQTVVILLFIIVIILVGILLFKKK